MARTKSPSKEVAKVHNTTAISTLDNVPDYLKDKQGSGLDNLGRDDFKVPRIKLLQALSPEVRTFQSKAIPGEFWHTGVNASLGNEFTFVPVSIGRVVALWQPRDNGGGLLAFSRNGHDWQMGANESFQVKIKGKKEGVIWDTKNNVQASGLLEWGSSNPDDKSSAPAATLIYQYLCYLPDSPNLSPVVMGLYRTAIGNAKQFNTSLLMLNRPSNSVAVRCFSSEQNEDQNTWFVPQFELKGYVGKDIYDATTKISEQYSDYEADYSEDDSDVAKKETEY